MADHSIEYRDNTSWEDLQWSDYRIELGTHHTQPVPKARIDSSAQADASEGDDIRIRAGGETIFEGEIRSGRYGLRGQRNYKCKHPAVDLFDDAVDVPVGTRNADDHLQEALDQSQEGGDFTLDYQATSNSFEYGAEDRKVKRIFRDICDEENTVFIVDPVDLTIVVDDIAGGGLWDSFDTDNGDGIRIQRWEPGDIDTVRNSIIVIGTREVAVAGSAEDSDSIDEYGRRREVVNYRGIADSATANAIAESLLRPDPLASGEIEIPESEASIYEHVSNQTVELSDSQRDISNEVLAIESQTIQPGRITVRAGEGGPAIAMDTQNRRSSSVGDVTAPGSVIDAERIAAETITAAEIDTLDLATGDLSVVDPGTGEGFDFDIAEFQGDTFATIRPTSDEIGNVGSDDNKLRGVRTRDLEVSNQADIATVVATSAIDGVQTDQIVSRAEPEITLKSDVSLDDNEINEVVRTEWTFTEDGGDTDVIFSVGAGQSTLRPVSNGNGRIGTGTSAWAEMNAEAFNEQSAPTFEGDALGVLSRVEYGSKRLPKFVLADEPDTDELHDGSGIDEDSENPDRINLGRMCSYLLSVCKEQNKRIERLEEQIKDL